MIGACAKKEFCITPSPVYTTLAFKTYNTKNVLVDTPLQNVDIYSIDPEVIFYENLESTISERVYLKRDITKQEFVIFQGNRRDTISVFYKPELNFVSNGCGYQTFFTIENVTFGSQSIDSVKINNALVNDAPKTYHLEVIYK